MRVVRGCELHIWQGGYFVSDDAVDDLDGLSPRPVESRLPRTVDLTARRR